MTRRMMRGHPHLERFLPAKRPTLRGRPTPWRTFYIPRRLKVMPDGRILSIQNHQTGSIIGPDRYGHTYTVLTGGPLKNNER